MSRHSSRYSICIHRVFCSVALIVTLSASGTDLHAQERDMQAERLVLDDNGSGGTQNTMVIQAPDSLSRNIVLTLPDPGVVEAEFLLVPPGTPGAWLLGGNAGTAPGTHFLGTRDSLILNSNGSIQRDTGGNARGTDAVDLQRNQFFDPLEVADGLIMVASGYKSTIAGGTFNIASGNSAAVGRGCLNTASNSHAVVCGGNGNTASGLGATVAGGSGNRAAATSSVVLGGFSNDVSGNYSTILGGRYLTLLRTGSVGFMANTGSLIKRMIVSDDKTAVFSNTDLWLANNDNSAGCLRFYEANNVVFGAPGNQAFNVLSTFHPFDVRFRSHCLTSCRKRLNIDYSPRPFLSGRPTPVCIVPRKTLTNVLSLSDIEASGEIALKDIEVKHGITGSFGVKKSLQCAGF